MTEPTLADRLMQMLPMAIAELPEEQRVEAIVHAIGQLVLGSGVHPLEVAGAFAAASAAILARSGADRAEAITRFVAIFDASSPSTIATAAAELERMTSALADAQRGDIAGATAKLAQARDVLFGLARDAGAGADPIAGVTEGIESAVLEALRKASEP